MQKRIALLEFLDILDDFISKLPDDKESGQRTWMTAAFSTRYKTEVALGVRPTTQMSSSR